VSFPSGLSTWPRPWANLCLVATGRRSPPLLGSLAPLLGPAWTHSVDSVPIAPVRLLLPTEVPDPSPPGVSTRRQTPRRPLEPPHATRKDPMPARLSTVRATSRHLPLPVASHRGDHEEPPGPEQLLWRRSIRRRRPFDRLLTPPRTGEGAARSSLWPASLRQTRSARTHSRS
jgi:hypothetical protein